MRFIYLLFCIFLLGASPVFAQQDPVEISAIETLEWDRNAKQYIARGAVEVQQGDMFLTCDTLTADYDEDAEGKTRITHLLAVGNVVLRDIENTATGARGTYNVGQGYARLTGGDLKLVSPDQTITASDALDYWRFKGEASAIGNAKVDRGEDVITARKITAFFSEQKNANGSSVDRIEAYDDVTITTPEEVLTGDRGTYNAANDTATLIGNVKIVRGPNELEGARAEVNLTTNISKMFGDAPTAAVGQVGTRGEDGRVRGIFFPGSDETNAQAAPAAPTPVQQPIEQPAPETLPVIEAPPEPVKTEPVQQPVQVQQNQPVQNQYVRPSQQIEDAARAAGSAFQAGSEE